MNRIEKLLEELCPEGVGCTTVKDVCTISRGKVYSKDYLRDNSGIYPVYSSQTANNGELGRISTYDFEGEYLTWTTDGAYAGTIFHRHGKFSITNVCGILKVKDGRLLQRFLYYWLSVTAKNYVYEGMGNPKLMSNQMATIPVPLPSLTIQEEIVKILDAFTNYQAELEAELEARKEQYEYYRNQLLTFDKDDEKIKWMTLGEVCTFINGRAYKQEELLSEGKYKVLRVGNFFTNDKWYYSDLELEPNKYCYKGDLLYAWSASFGPQIWDGDKTIFHYHIWNVKFDESLLLKRYLYHFFEFDKQQIKASTTGSTMVHVSMQSMKKRVIPIPPISEQERIVAILDKFEALVNDLTHGLPAEIAAVQEQYEYYRNKLLTFKPKEVC